MLEPTIFISRKKNPACFFFEHVPTPENEARGVKLSDEHRMARILHIFVFYFSPKIGHHEVSRRPTFHTIQ
jgi:hypothetical protein